MSDGGQQTNISHIRAAVLLSLLVAGTVRLLYARWAGPDFFGDAYHHWLISRLTLANDWLYTDYKGLEAVWLPGYHYLISAAMAISGQLDLTPAHATNLVLGSLACGLVTQLVARITRNWRTGLGAGLTLALLPWHIAYSAINMPEILAGVLLLLSLLAVQHGHAGWLAALALVTTLTRHELTLMMVLLALWLGFENRHRGPDRRRWLPTLGLAMGAALGLGMWSVWSQHVTGAALAWWTRYRVATAWDARFWMDAGARLADPITLGKAAMRAFPPLTVIGPLIIASLLHPRWRRRYAPGECTQGWLLIAPAGFHWLSVGLGFIAGHLPVADPRYLLVSLPALVSGGSIALAAVPHRQIRWGLAGLVAVLVLVSFLQQLPDFSDRSYVLAPERAAGEYLGTVASDEGNFWIDAPVSIYFSRLDPERFFSSDQLLPPDSRWQSDTPAVALQAMLANDIRYVLWEDVSYTFVQHVWPQMAEGQAFDQGSYRFEPVFRYSGWELDYGARPTIIWQIEAREAEWHFAGSDCQSDVLAGR